MSNKKQQEIDEETALKMRNYALEETTKANLAVYEKDGWSLASKTAHGYMHMWPGLMKRINGVEDSVWMRKKNEIAAKFPDIQTGIAFPLAVRVPDVCIRAH